MKVKNKVVVVTGAGSGMGRELTLELVRRGASVAALDMRKESLAETKKLADALNGKVEIFEVDVTDDKKVAALPAKIEKTLGKVDALINNAGIIQPFVHVKDLSLESAHKVMDVNFTGPLLLVKAFLPGLLTRPEAHILNVSSMGSYAPVPGQTLYGATKAALNMLTEGLRSELKETNVNLTLVWPGAIGTNISANSGVSFGSGELTEAQKKAAARVTAPAAAGKMIVDAIESNARRIYVGSDAKMMGNLIRLSPDFAANLIYKNMKSLLG